MNYFLHTLQLSKRFVFRKPIIWASFLAMFVFCVWVYVKFIPEKDPLAMLHVSQYGQMSAMFFFMIFASLYAKQEAQLSFDELISSMTTQRIREFLTKTIFIAILSALFSFCILGANSVAYAIMHMPGSVYIYAIKMTVLYYFFPCLICGIIGLCVSIQITSQLVYALLVAIWLLVSPISQQATAFIFQLFHTSSTMLQYMFSLLSLGEHILTGSTPTYGIPFEPLALYVQFVRLAFILSYSVLIFWVSLAKKRARIAVNTLFLLFFVCIAFAAHTKHFEKFQLYHGRPELRRYAYDSDYYYKFYNHNVLRSDALPSFPRDALITPKEYKVKLVVGALKASVECELSAIVVDDAKSISFTLYRDLVVNSIENNSAHVEFEQAGDYINVQFEKALKKGERVKLTFQYSGTSSPAFQANEGAVYLPGNYPWLPYPGMRLPLQNSNYWNSDGYVLFDGIQLIAPVKYELVFESPYETYTNLMQVSNSFWKGESKDGLSIYSDPLMVRKIIDGKNIYYSASMQPDINKVIRITNKTGEVLSDMFMILNPSQKSDFKNVLVLPILPVIEHQGVVRNYSMHDDLFLYFESPIFIQGYLERRSSDTLLSSDPMPVIPSDVYTAFDAIRNQPKIVKALIEQPVNKLMFDAFGQWYLQDCGLNNITKQYFTFSKTLKELMSNENEYYSINATALEDEDHKVITRIANVLENAVQTEPSLLKSLFSMWYDRLISGEPMNSSELLGLFEGGR